MTRSFESFYGRPARWTARAPGRVNLIGEHTDYNGGFVLPMAIERHTEIAAAPNDSNTVRLHSTAVDETLNINLADPIEAAPAGSWKNYPEGVLAGFMEAGHALRGFDAIIHSTVPLGAGLSSSASLEVAFATLLEGVAGIELEPARKASLCREAEHRYARVPCGIMDQFIAARGREDHLLLLDCRSQEPDWIEFADPLVSVLIVSTPIKHQLASSEYTLRRSQCEAAARTLGVACLREATKELLERSRCAMDDILYRRARHVLSECARTLSAAQAFRERNWLRAGELMYASHESLRDDFEVSSPELDVIVEIARNIGPRGGVYGCRMTGGGFGGCAVALVGTRAEASIAHTISNECREKAGFEPTLIVSRPAPGATLVTHV